MAVHLRLRRMGAKKRAFYRIVATDSRKARDGRFIEILGTYNPITVPARVTVAEDKISYWFDQGAEVSDTVRSLLRQIGFSEKYEKRKRGEDVSEIVLKTELRERPKKTRRVKKAAAKAEAEKEAEAKAKKEAEAAKEAEAKAKKEAEAAKAAEAANAEAETAAETPAEGGSDEAEKPAE